jgi:type II secretory pathway pseudopilin PulG
MAAVALPRFSSTTGTARASMLADDLRVMRMQIEVFTGHHNIPPGYPGCDPDAAPTEEAYVQYMTMASKLTGEVAAPGTPGYLHGPYLREIPPNPVNGKTSVQIIPDTGSMPASADDSDGWVYQPLTKTIRADCQGNNPDGVSYYTY